MIWSFLQGHMGYAYSDAGVPPRAAVIVVGDFAFFAGKADEALVRTTRVPILAPGNIQWEALIERVWSAKAQRSVRYALKKEGDHFDRARLRGYIQALPACYQIGPIEERIYTQLGQQTWSKDLRGLFHSWPDFHRRGIGVVIQQAGRVVAGASAYSVYTGGIEIQIDTSPRYRRQGLATVCGAWLILNCLERGLYPSWDAQNLHSLALAQKLGYREAGPYPVYLLSAGE